MNPLVLSQERMKNTPSDGSIKRLFEGLGGGSDRDLRDGKTARHRDTRTESMGRTVYVPTFYYWKSNQMKVKIYQSHGWYGYEIVQGVAQKPVISRD